MDTAPAYGNSEEKIGQLNNPNFSYITKIPSLKNYPLLEDKIRAINYSVNNSLSNLGTDLLFCILFHDANDLINDEGIRLYEELNKLKEAGITQNIGVSLYNGVEIDLITSSFMPDIIQVPINILDQRLIHSGHLEKLKSLGVKVHARSIFLQGLFHMPINDLPDYFQPIKPILLKISNQVMEQGLSINQAALSFVRELSDIDNILIGVESLIQLNDGIGDFSLDCSFDPNIPLKIDDKFLNPAKWSLISGN